MRSDSRKWGEPIPAIHQWYSCVRIFYKNYILGKENSNSAERYSNFQRNQFTSDASFTFFLYTVLEAKKDEGKERKKKKREKWMAELSNEREKKAEQAAIKDRREAGTHWKS